MDAANRSSSGAQTSVWRHPRGAKHSPPGGKFQKSEGPPVAMAESPFHSDSWGQIVSKWKNLNIDEDSFRRRFQWYPPKVLNPSAGVETQPHF